LLKLKIRGIITPMYQRILFKDGLPESSVFLLGPRQTGKTTLLETLQIGIQYNLLESNLFLKLNKDPDLLLRECTQLNHASNHTIWIDEVQKIPKLLDTVHQIIEKHKNIKFILSGSSARKLRQEGVNLLGGRALDYKFHPLIITELTKEFDLEIALHYGTLPKIYKLAREGNVSLAQELLSAYVSIYL
jgi:uncharacterized protein